MFEIIDRLLRTLPSSVRGVRCAQFFLVALFGCVVLARLGAPAITKTAEERCSDVIRNMVETGDWLVPVRHGEPRLQKPPLYYWMGAAAAEVSGGPSLFALRLPAALSALALLLLAMAWGERLGGPRMALTTGALLVCMLQFSTLGRRGVAEMTLALWSTAALLVFCGSGGRRRLLLFSLFLALAFLSKATAALLTVCLPILVFLALEKRLRRALRPGVMGALAVALVLGFIWYAVVMVRVPGAFDQVYSDLILPLGMETAHHTAVHYRPVWFYVSHVAEAAFPAALLLPAVLFCALRTRVYGADPSRRFLGVAFLTIFLGLSLMPQKQKHYSLPLMPLLALLTADAVLWMWDQRRTWLLRAARPLGGLLGVGLLGMAGVLAVFFKVVLENETPLGWLLVALVAVPGGFCLAGALRHKLLRLSAAFVLGFGGADLAYQGWIQTWRAQVDVADETGRPFPHEEMLLRLAREQPLLVDLMGVEKKVRRRLNQARKESGAGNPGEDD